MFKKINYEVLNLKKNLKKDLLNMLERKKERIRKKYKDYPEIFREQNLELIKREMFENLRKKYKNFIEQENKLEDDLNFNLDENLNRSY